MIGSRAMGQQTLTPRQVEILVWAARGKTYWETGAILGIKYSSIHGHINTIKLKLSAVNITHAVARGYELGILELRTAEPMPALTPAFEPVPNL
jgi:DNA-binding CsgD family transcriptional regulator